LALNEAFWQRVEYGAYAADLPLWDALAQVTRGPVLELGCGVGRVALHLGRRGHEVTGLDLDPVLIDALEESARGLPVAGVVGNVCELDPNQRFGLVLGPMQLIQALPNRAERLACLSCVAGVLTPHAVAAFAIDDLSPSAGDPVAAHHDIRYVDGCLFSSQCLDPHVVGDLVAFRRLRQLVVSGGRRRVEVDEQWLCLIDATTLEHEGERVGLRPIGRQIIPATETVASSAVVIFKKETV
jgi:SAM-dependent methyltransferase